MLKKAPKRLNWALETEEVLSCLKRAFTTAPILKHPDASKPVIVEVDITYSLFLNAIMWVIDQLIANSLPLYFPEECPADRTFIPTQCRAQLITWVHTTGHSGTHPTHDLLYTKY